MDKYKIQIFITLTLVVVLALITGIIIYIFQYRKRRLLNIKEQQEMKREHQQELLSTQLEMQTQTMQHIGREIHDNVGQKLTLASLYTQQLAYENKAPQINDKIESISHIINESLAELRQLSKSLTDDSIDNNSITELLQQECDKINNLKKCNAHFTCSRDNIALPYQTKSILVRIVQEFLQNSIKHADCRNIYVVLKTGDTTLELDLNDDGKGFETTSTEGKGIGLANIKKRTALIGGSCRLESEIGKGTALNIIIPL
ncbi:sensor histidine kinase [Ferruginibacter sp.]